MNPYKLIFDLFYEINLRGNTAIFKDKKEVYKKVFNQWVDEFYFNRIYNRRLLTVFMDGTCNFLIEKCNEIQPFDCEEFLDSVKTYSGPKSDVLNYCLNEANSIQFNFDEMYDIKSAKKIYVFFKKYFLSCDCDPFSFTNDNISDFDKKKFLHDRI